MNRAEIGYIIGATVMAVYVFISTLTDFSLGEWLQRFNFP